MLPIPPFADRDDEYVYVIQDMIPSTGVGAAYIGVEISGYTQLHEPLAELIGFQGDAPSFRSSARSKVFQTHNHSVVVTGLLDLSFLGGRYGMVSFTTVFDDDPNAFVVIAVTMMDDFINSVHKISGDALVTITDHRGFQSSSGNCSVADVEQSLDQEIPLTRTADWLVQIGQCPQYKEHFVTMKRYVVLLVCIITTLLAITVALFTLVFQRKNVQQALERARAEEKAAAHQLIVGYICHELRNPLHIVKSSLASLIHCALKNIAERLPVAELHQHLCEFSALLADMGGITMEDALPAHDDVISVVRDAKSALAQMQSTVNEVLDFRAIESGLNSLKLDCKQVVLGDVIMPVLLRCRSFLHHGVELKVIMPSPSATVHVDPTRLAQIITNGLRYVGNAAAEIAGRNLTSPCSGCALTISSQQRGQVHRGRRGHCSRGCCVRSHPLRCPAR